MRSVDLYKIGVSAKPQRRLDQLRTGNPHTELVAVSKLLPDSASRELEGWLHSRFVGTKVAGEWFKLSASQVKEVLELCTVSEAELQRRRKAEIQQGIDKYVATLSRRERAQWRRSEKEVEKAEAKMLGISVRELRKMSVDEREKALIKRVQK